MTFETLQFQDADGVVRVVGDRPPVNITPTKLMIKTRGVVLTGAGSTALSTGVDQHRSG